jgi:hypothetical protein
MATTFEFEMTQHGYGSEACRVFAISCTPPMSPTKDRFGRKSSVNRFGRSSFFPQSEVERRQLHLELTVDLPEQMHVNGHAVQQAALNLLLNACTASPVGGNVVFVAQEMSVDSSLAWAIKGPTFREPLLSCWRKLIRRRPQTKPGLGLDGAACPTAIGCPCPSDA